MSAYKKIRQNLKGATDRKTVRKWRKQLVITRIRKPSNLTSARSLGYRAKQGFVMVRIRIKKGGRKRHMIKKARKQTKTGQVKYTTGQSKQSVAEKRAARKYPNLEVLNSYLAGEDGQYKYYDVIFIDTSHPSIIKDKKLTIKHQRKRVFRGLTSAGKKSRK